MVDNQVSRPAWKKYLLGVFIALAAVGVIFGTIKGAKPDAFGGGKPSSSSPATKSSSSSSSLDANTSPVSPTTSTIKGSTTTSTTPTASTIVKPVSSGSSPTAAITGSSPTATITSTGAAAAPIPQVLQGLSGATGAGQTSTQDLVNNVLTNKGAGNGAACVPQDGPSFVSMAQDPNNCVLITLKSGTKYSIGASEVVITGRKVIIGNPIAAPILDASGAKRLFRVAAGGSLDLQWVITWRGGGELIETIPVLKGGSALVELGGRASFLGVIFTNAPPSSVPPVLVAPDLSRAVRVFGGQVFVAGGVVTFTLCHFWVLQPGVLLREIYVIGADVLVTAGVVALSGCTFTNSQLFLNGFGAGFQLAVLGGVLIGSGVTFTINFLAINATGAGILSFIGGGIAIFSGCVWNANLGILSHFGSGIFIFLGGGVLVVTGGAFSANIGIGIECGTAIMTSVGGGTITMTGVAQEVSVGIDFYAGAGILNFLGAGSAVNVGVSMARNIAIAGVYGTGGSQHVGAGSQVSIGCPTTDNYAIVGAVVIGGDWFLGAGILVEIACPFVKSIGLMWAVFVGIHGFVGAGGAVVGYSPGQLNLGKVWVNTNHPPATLYYVDGNAISPTPTDTLYYLNQDGLTDIPKRDLQATGNYTASFAVLSDSNDINGGIPNAFVKAVQNGPAGRGPTQISAKYAFIDGDTLCNTCSFQGIVSEEFTGDSADSCASTDEACSIATLSVVGADGTPQLLPQWAKEAASTYDPSSNQLPLINTQVVTAQMKVGCSSTTSTPSYCTSADDLASIIQSKLSSCSRVNVQDSNAVKHDELADEALSNAADAFPKSQTTDVFDVAFTTHDSQCTDEVKSFIENYDPTKLAADLQANVPTSSTKIDTSSAELNTVHTVPGLNMANALKQLKDVVAATASNGGMVPSLVVGADTATSSALSLPALKAGANLPVNLSGFSPNKPVAFELTPTCLSTNDGVDLGSFTPNTAAEVSSTFKVPANLAPGTYSIKGTQSNFAWCSQPFDVSS